MDIDRLLWGLDIIGGVDLAVYPEGSFVKEAARVIRGLRGETGRLQKERDEWRDLCRNFQVGSRYE